MGNGELRFNEGRIAVWNDENFQRYTGVVSNIMMDGIHLKSYKSLLQFPRKKNHINQNINHAYTAFTSRES